MLLAVFIGATAPCLAFPLSKQMPSSITFYIQHTSISVPAVQVCRYQQYRTKQYSTVLITHKISITNPGPSFYKPKHERAH